MGIDDAKFRDVLDRLLAPIIDEAIAELIADGCTPAEAEEEVFESFKRAVDEALGDLDRKG
jgi:hypothetical protein